MHDLKELKECNGRNVDSVEEECKLILEDFRSVTQKRYEMSWRCAATNAMQLRAGESFVFVFNFDSLNFSLWLVLNAAIKIILSNLKLRGLSSLNYFDMQNSMFICFLILFSR